jgi:origin recognition complex subunit 3
MLLEDQDTDLVRSLLDSDEYLLKYIKDQIKSGIASLKEILSTTEILMVLQRRFPLLQQQPKSTILVDALAGQLGDSNLERNMFLHLKRSNSEALLLMLQEMIPIISGNLLDTCTRLLTELQTLQSQQKDDAAPLRSEQDVQNATLRTTVVAKKVELSKQKSTLTKSDAAYSNLLNQFVQALQTHLTTTLINPKDLAFNEVFLYDLKSPHKDVFTPKPRGAIERALSSPHDYLDCACCVAPDGGRDDEENTLASTQPSTAVLYQLYLESGAMINVADLRTAFVTILGDDEQDEVQTK